MAERGKPLSFNTREQIKAQRSERTVREVARNLAVSKTTVQKYSSKIGTK